MHTVQDVRSCEYTQPPRAFTRIKRVDMLYLGAYMEGGCYFGWALLQAFTVRILESPFRDVIGSLKFAIPFKIFKYLKCTYGNRLLQLVEAFAWPFYHFQIPSVSLYSVRRR